MQSFHGPEDHKASSAQGDDPLERLDAVVDEMLANQTPRQQELAARIWDRFVAGDDVDDVKDLIAELSRTATEDAERRHEIPRTGSVQ